MEKENKKYARTTPAQLRFYINFIRTHPELLQGKNCPTSPNCIKMLWQDIASNLNAMLGPTRTPDPWKEALRNWRKQLQARARKIINERNRTGGGQNFMLELSEFEHQALEAFGIAAVEGHSGVTLCFTVLTNAENGQQPSAESSLPPTPICCTSSTISPNPYEVPNAAIPSTSPLNTEVLETRRSTKTFREALLELVQQDIQERKVEQARLTESLASIANSVSSIAEAIKELVFPDMCFFLIVILFV